MDFPVVTRSARDQGSLLGGSRLLFPHYQLLPQYCNFSPLAELIDAALSYITGYAD